MQLKPWENWTILGAMEKEAVITEALALPERGRAEVAARLLESLGGPGVAMTDDELLEEARRRSEEMDQIQQTRLPKKSSFGGITRGLRLLRRTIAATTPGDLATENNAHRLKRGQAPSLLARSLRPSELELLRPPLQRSAENACSSTTRLEGD